MVGLVEIINILLALGLVFYWVVAFAIFYHLSRFGVGVLPKRLAVVFLMGSAVLSFIAIFIYARLDLNTLL